MRRWVRIAVAAAVVIVLAVVAVVVVSRVRAAQVEQALLDGSVVSASSVADGYAPRSAVIGDTALPKQGWRADEQTVGAWIGVRWPFARPVTSVTIERPDLAEPGVTDGFLAFGDGSFLQVRLSTTSRTTTVPIGRRDATSMRFTVTAVAKGTTEAELTRFAVDEDAPETVHDAAEGAGAAAAVRQTGGGSPAALVDGSATSLGRVWSADAAAGRSIDLVWTQPRELVAVQLVGADGSPAAVRSATLRFADGATVPIGGVPSVAAIPTTVAFMPRVTTHVRLTIDAVTGDGPLRLSELRFQERGDGPPAKAAAAHGVAVTAPAATACADATAASSADFAVACPLAGSRVGDRQDVLLTVPAGYTTVRADVWPASGPATTPTVSVPASSRTVVPLRLDTMPSGPVTVQVTATGVGVKVAVARFQLLHGTASAAIVRSSRAADGRTLVWDEEFDGPVSLTADGADARYTASKPEPKGVSQFGDAIFGDPADGFGNIGTLDDRYLRLMASDYPGSDPTDPARSRLGGILASARSGGSGFSAQYGYFEARMLVTAMPGTWPAFWLLPSTNLTEQQRLVAEFDAIELYGHDPVTGCNSTHGYVDGEGRTGVADCGTRFSSDRSAAQWHTYGVRVSPDRVVFFIDGRQVSSAAQEPGGGDPMFFMANLALGGGWPIDLDPTEGRAQVLVDWVRAYA